MTELSADIHERTILTTDVVGSTALLRRYPNDMLSAMDLLDRILYVTIRRHSGDPLRSTGDGVPAIFNQPLSLYLPAQHCGNPISRRAGDLNPAVNPAVALLRRQAATRTSIWLTGF